MNIIYVGISERREKVGHKLIIPVWVRQKDREKRGGSFEDVWRACDVWNNNVSMGLTIL